MADYSDGNYLFDNDLKALEQAIKGEGVRSGLQVTASTTPDDYVHVAAGEANVAGTIVTKSSTTDLQIPANTSGNPRKDIIVMDSSGTISVVQGTPAPAKPDGYTHWQTYEPAPPDIPANSIILAEIWVADGFTSITSSDILDKRNLVLDIDTISPTTTKGDILVDNGTNLVRLPVGADGQVLGADSTKAEGVAWRNVYGAYTIVANDGTGDYNCDGVDDQVEIQQAIDYVNGKGGGIVVFRAGTYYISGTILLKSNVALDLRGATIKVPDGVDLPNYAGMIEVYSGTQNAKIFGGTIDMNMPNAATQSYERIGVRVLCSKTAETKNIVIDGTTFMNGIQQSGYSGEAHAAIKIISETTGMDNQGKVSMLIKECIFDTCGNGIDVVNRAVLTPLYIVSCVAKNCGGHGILVRPGVNPISADTSDFVIKECHCINNGTLEWGAGIAVDADTHSRYTVSGNVCRKNSGDGIYSKTTGDSTGIIFANQCHDNGDTGIAVDTGTSNVVISSNYVSKSNYNGIYALSSSNILIVGNVFFDNGTGSLSGHMNAIRIENVSNSTIMGNYAYKVNTSPIEETFVYELGTSDNNFISNNKIEDHATPFVIVGANTRLFNNEGDTTNQLFGDLWLKQESGATGDAPALRIDAPSTSNQNPGISFYIDGSQKYTVGYSNDEFTVEKSDGSPHIVSKGSGWPEVIIDATGPNQGYFVMRRSGVTLGYLTQTDDFFAIGDGTGSIADLLRFYMSTSSPGRQIEALVQMKTKGIVRNTATKTANYTLTQTDEVILADASSGAFTLTLPSAASVGAGQEYTIKKIDGSTNAITIDPNGTETIDGAATYSLASQWKYVTIVSDGANWVITANN
jgi:parallel beta-helix repeat protein